MAFNVLGNINKTKLMSELSDKPNKQLQCEKNFNDIKQDCIQSSGDCGYFSSDILPSDILSSDNQLQPQSKEIINDNDLKQHCSQHTADSGIFSDEMLSSDCVMLSYNSNIVHNIKHEDNFNMKPLKEKIDTFDSILDCSIPDNIKCAVLEDTFKPVNHDWWSYFDQNEDGDTQLHIAIIHGYTLASKRLIDNCPDYSLLNIRNDEGQTALHLAVITNECEILKLLMAANANAAILDCNGNTAVHLACYDGKLKCLEIILASNLFQPKILDIINYDGLACIHIAIISNHLNLLEKILKTCANKDIADYKSGYTALHFAVALKREDLIEECIKGKVNKDIISYSGKKAFEFEEVYDSDSDYDEDEEDFESFDDHETLP